MAGFRNIRQLASAFESGRSHSCSFRKVPSQASTAGWWVDLSMASGNPVPQFYANTPLAAATLPGGEGIFHGADKSPEQKHLVETMLVTPTAGLVGRYMLLDYLLFYPFVDLDTTDAQTMTNDVALPRYTDGAGVRVMLVAAYPTVGGGSFTFDYVNQDGQPKTSPVISCATTAVSIASIITSEPATVAGGQPFLPLASGDTGVRSITGVSMIGTHGGLGAFVLVKPLADAVVREINTPCEKSLVVMQPGAPRIYDGAYLNWIVQCSATVAAGQLAGRATFAWS